MGQDSEDSDGGPSHPSGDVGVGSRIVSLTFGGTHSTSEDPVDEVRVTSRVTYRTYCQDSDGSGESDSRGVLEEVSYVVVGVVTGGPWTVESR